jgi:triacylglycerol lipase
MSLPKLRSPIILVHGLLGFDRFKLGNWTIVSNFPKIPEFLEAAGNRVFVAWLSPTGGVAERAVQLKDFVNKVSPQEPVHLLAHSMGGLDSRYLISRLDMAPRVLSLTTLGTPHRGTPFADWGIRRFEPILKPLVTQLRIPVQAFYDVTTAQCKLFNEAVPDMPGVRYFSVAGQYEGGWHSPEWILSHSIVTQAEGPNDGVVSVASARYGESLEVWPGDHVSLINWFNPWAWFRRGGMDRTGQYGSLVCRLKDEGF